MDGDQKKRKRGENGELKGGGDRRNKEEQPVPNAATVAQPSEEEVEEFFTILRRMHVAVKYFEKNGASINDVNGVGLNLTASERTSDAAANGVKIEDNCEKKSETVGSGGLELDLNALPEDES